MGLAPAFEMMVRRVAALGVLAVTTPSIIQAQIGLSSGSAQIALIARVPSRASIAGISTTRETARLGTMREGTVKVRLSANTGYRLVVVGTQPVDSKAGPSRLWVRAETGRFEELKSGGAVTVSRGHHAGGEWEQEVSYRSEASESGEGPQVLPLRYELRIDPAI